VAEVAYQPTACHRTYRLIIVRQTIAVEKGQTRLFEQGQRELWERLVI
jgi:hypothetical protein